MEKIIDEINAIVSSFDFFEFSINSYKDNLLTLFGSEDFIYYHNIEIIFNDIFTIISNINWRVDTQSKSIDILTGPLKVELNIKYFVEKGYTIFVLYNEEGIPQYIIAKSIRLVNKVTKYYT